MLKEQDADEEENFNSNNSLIAIHRHQTLEPAAKSDSSLFSIDLTDVQTKWRSGSPNNRGSYSPKAVKGPGYVLLNLSYITISLHVSLFETNFHLQT